MDFIFHPNTKPKLISEYWVHYGPVLQDTDALVAELRAGRHHSAFNPRNFVYRHIFDLDMNALGWELLPEDHLLVNDNGSIVISDFANRWAKRNGVEWFSRCLDDLHWIEVNGARAAMKVKLRWA